MGQKLGFRHKEESKEKIGNKNRDSGSGMWKGDYVGYRSIHFWISRRLGRAQEKNCIDCCVSGEEKRLEWSNIDHQYRRDIKDYHARCISCHRKHDKELPRFYALKV